MHNCERFGHLQDVRAAETLQTSHRPDGRNAEELALILAFVHLRLTLRSTTVGTCRRDLKSSHRPDGIFTCLALVFAGRRCSCPEWLGDLLIVHHHWQLSWRLCACSCSKVPIAPMGETHVLLVFTGGRCLCLFRHRHNDVLLDHRQHSLWIGACSCSKLPIAPLGC